MEKEEGRIPRLRRHCGRVGVVALALSFALSACKRETEEDRVRAVIHRAVEAGNEKSVRGILEDAAPSFKGPGDASLDESRRILVGYFLSVGGGWTKSFEQDLQVTIDAPDRAHASLDLLIARGNPVNKIEDVVPTNAGHFVFSLELAKIDGAWKFTRASYKQIAL